MATYRVYDNILIKLESVYLKVEMEVDREITEFLSEQHHLEKQINDLKVKVEILNSLKRTNELYCDNHKELYGLTRTLLKNLCDKQILLRFVREKELLLNGYLMPTPDMKLPALIELNKEFKLRKRLQEIELLAGFLSEQPSFQEYAPKLEKLNEIYDLALESGAIDKLEETIGIFDNFFEKVQHIYVLDQTLLDQFSEFRVQVIQQANHVYMFTANDIFSSQVLQTTYKNSQQERLDIEREVEKLMYQFMMLQNGKKIILTEIKNTTGELESLIFKEYAIKQKIQELRNYKAELNTHKDCFMKAPSVDGYSEAVKQLESVERRLQRLTMNNRYDQESKEVLISRFFTANKTKQEKRFKEEQTTYNKILFLTLHNAHISSEDKLDILRVAKTTRLINSHSGKFFYQRMARNTSLQNLQQSFDRFNVEELH